MSCEVYIEVMMKANIEKSLCHLNVIFGFSKVSKKGETLYLIKLPFVVDKVMLKHTVSLFQNYLPLVDLCTPTQYNIYNLY